MERTSEGCEVCNENPSILFRFRSTILQEFNSLNTKVEMSTVWLHEITVLDIGYQEVNFQNEIFISVKSIHELYNYFVDCWVCIYTAFPEIMTLDGECSFTSEEFKENAKGIVVDLKISVIEAQNSIIKGERHHFLLRRTFDVAKSKRKH